MWFKAALFCITKNTQPAKRQLHKKGVNIMYELVEVRENDIFTTSKIIAEGTNNRHNSVTAIIQKYEEDFKEFGTIRFVDLKSKNLQGGRPEKVYYLNEEQATLLMTYLRNNETVRKFKKNLVHQFYKMRRFLIEKQSKLWNDTRDANRENRLSETDVIKLLTQYAAKQGSKHSNKLYAVYTKLARNIVTGDRDNMNISELNNLTLVESIIKQTIEIDMSIGMHYKEIYKDCKERIVKFAEIAYLKQNEEKEEREKILYLNIKEEQNIWEQGYYKKGNLEFGIE